MLWKNLFFPQAEKVLLPRMLLQEMPMNDLYSYFAAVAQALVMVEKGIITEREFQQFEEKMRQRYNLPENSIFRLISLDQ